MKSIKKTSQPHTRSQVARAAWDRVAGPHEKRGVKRRRNERRTAKQSLKENPHDH